MSIEKSFLKSFLEKFQGVSFEMVFWDGERMLIGDNPPEFTLELKKPLKEKDILRSTSLAFGEAYMDGNLLITGDLFHALDALLSNIGQFTTNFRALPKIFGGGTSKSKQKEEVTSHYNIGNDFYRLWLDETMSYSCAYFENENDTLYEAQMNKIHHLLKKMHLSEGQTLLDIGCGWGYLLIEAAKMYKIKGVGITLSEEQHKKCLERIKEEHLEDYLDFKLMDYRDLSKSDDRFDRVVSVGMLEHVGRTNYNVFFENVDSVLKKGGIFQLHYISGTLESKGDAWIKKYIFPGGMIPTLREIISISADYNYHTIDVENLRSHYVKTLLEWHKNFEENIDQVEEMFDERFIRMWRMYLCSCAASFHNGVIDLSQITFTKGINNTLPMTR